MPENKSDNKRVKIGLAIFAVLVLANVFVHGGRAMRSSGPAASGGAPASQVSKPDVAVTSAKPGADIVTLQSGPDKFIEERTAPLAKKLEELKKRMKKVATPLLPPDSGVNLPLSEREFFVVAQTAARPEFRPAAVSGADKVARPLKILGEFSVNGQARLLVQSETGVWVVGNEILQGGEGLELVARTAGSYLVNDGAGSSVTLESANITPDSLTRAVKILKGDGSGAALKLLQGGAKK